MRTALFLRSQRLALKTQLHLQLHLPIKQSSTNNYYIYFPVLSRFLAFKNTSENSFVLRSKLDEQHCSDRQLCQNFSNNYKNSRQVNLQIHTSTKKKLRKFLKMISKLLQFLKRHKGRGHWGHGADEPLDGHLSEISPRSLNFHHFYVCLENIIEKLKRNRVQQR